MGISTGFKSYRCKVFERFPRTGIPDVFANWADYETFVNLLVKTGCIDNGKKIWWDIRPHPHFPRSKCGYATSRCGWTKPWPSLR